MPKRHRQPEPIEIDSATYHSRRAATREVKNASTQSGAASNASSSIKPEVSAAVGLDERSAYSPGEQKLVEETCKKVMDFPATPEILARHRRQREANARRRRVSYDRDGQLLNEDDAEALAARHHEKAQSAKCPPDSAFSPPSHSSPASNSFDVASEDELEFERENDGDLSSDDYVGDDGNQPRTYSELDSAEEDDESELRKLRKAVAAAAAQRRRAGEEENSSNTSSPKSVSGEEDAEEDSDDVLVEDDEGNSNEGEETSGETDISLDFNKDDESLLGASQSDSDEDGEDTNDELDDGGLITVDFGVFDMEKSNIDGLLHLMDQLCPDKMNEVDRDDLGLALYESPFTSVVRLQNNGEDATGEEAQEFYGLSSVLDVAHGQQLYPTAMRPLCELLQQHVWRQAASGIPPTDILTSVVDDEHAAASRARCLLLISEYIRNIPLELTVQILEDVLDRLDAAGNEESKPQQQRTAATHENPIFATHPCMFAVLAKVQRSTDAPVTLPKSRMKQQLEQKGISDTSGETAPHTQSSLPVTGASKVLHHKGKKSEKPACVAGGAMGAPEAPLDLTHYIFWREEDSILYEFRDKRVAALVYRCRPQYDGQPEHEIPLSIFFVLQYGAVRQAVDEMKRRQTVNAAVEHY